MMNFFRRLHSRLRCKLKGHRYHPISTYMTKDLGNLHFKGKIKLVCKCCQRGALTSAEFQFSQENQELMMSWDLPED